MSKTAAVAGAGIGGLTTALCLARTGWQVTVLEQADQLSEVGAGLQLSPNACRVLDALGLLPAIEAVAFAPRAIEMRFGRRTRAGRAAPAKPILSIPLRDEALARWGAPYLHVHRADLLNVLVEAARSNDRISIRTGARLKCFDQGAAEKTASRVRIELDSGETLTADLLVGADGLHSTVAEQLPGDHRPRFSGNVAWRMTVPMDALGDHQPPPNACIWVGAGRHAVTYQLRNGALANLVGVVETDDVSDESWSAQGSKAQALADFDGWDPVVTGMIEAADTHYRWALFDRDPLKQWFDQRVVLVGDACHPVLPFLAQGAAMAIEDAWVLAHALQSRDSMTVDLVAGLAAYAAQRQPRTRRVLEESRANARRFHRGSSLAYAPLSLAANVAPSFFHARQDWLYGHDVTGHDVTGDDGMGRDHH